MPEEEKKRTRGRWRVCWAFTRETCSHTWACVVYLFNLVLIALAVLLIIVLVRDDLPVPSFLNGRIQRELAARGFAMSFDRARFDPTGRILVEGLRLEPPRFGEPILSARLVVVQLDGLALVTTGRPVPVRIDAEGVRVLCPAMISPSGMTETLVEIASVRARNADEHWTLDGLAATAGSLRLTAHGDFLVGRAKQPSKPVEMDALVRQFAEVAPKIARALEQLAPFTEPRVDIAFSGKSGKPLAIEATVSAASWHDKRVGEASGIRLATNLQISNGAATAPFSVAVRLDSFDREDIVHAEHVALVGNFSQLPSAEKPWPEYLKIMASRLVHPKAEISGATIEARPAGWPQIEADARFDFEGETLVVSARGDALKRSGEATIHSRLGRTWTAKASEMLGRDVTYYATIDTPPDFATQVQFDEGLKWRRADFRFLSGPLNARGVALDRTRVLGFATPERVKIARLEIARGDESGVGSYEDVLATRDYRFLLRGSMRPLSVAPWFGGWWGRFWNDYKLNGPPPWFDVDIHNNWLAGETVVVTGSAHVEQLVLKGVAVPELDTHFFIRPNYFDLFDATLLRDEGRLDGEVQLLYAQGQSDPRRQVFRFNSTADLVDMARIFGKGGEEMLAAYRYEIPPAVEVSGTVQNDAGKYDTQLDVHIETKHAFRYHEFPLESLSTQALIHNFHVELPAIVAGYAGGTVHANAIADNGRLTFEAALSDSDYDLAVDTFNAYLATFSPPTPEEEEPGGLTSKKAGGRLAITLAASGPTTQFRAYEGKGTIHITEAELGHINILGLFSDFLRAVGVKIGDLGFKEVTSNFAVQRDRIKFTETRIAGNTAALQTEGMYFMADKNLDFKARLYPLRASSGALTQIFGVILDPFSFLLEVRLTGTLKKPHWSLTRDPFNILRQITGGGQQQQHDGAPPAAENPPTTETLATPDATTPATPAPKETPPENR